MTHAVAYYRTSSATNVKGDSELRQREAVDAFAEANGYVIEAAFYDAAVSGADPVDTRPQFAQMLRIIEGAPDIKVILVENASRFARDLAVQLAGHAMLKARGIELIPVDAPTYFTDPSPTAEMVRQILGAVAQFEKAALVAKLKHARDRKRAETGRCGGPQPVPADHVDYATRFWQTGMSLREISAAMTCNGRLNANGRPYSASSIKNMLEA